MSNSIGQTAALHPLRHVAVIMDGNNRWAKSRGLSGLAGHERGVERVRDAMDSCERHNIPYLTVFAFSSENWARPSAEVHGLLALFSSYLKKEIPELQQRGVRLRFIGERGRFSERLTKQMAEAETKTSRGKMTLTLAVDYGGRWDIVDAARKLALKVQSGQLRPEDITEELFDRHISTVDIPPPDLCIRTAGEQRISNFMLWQQAYTEFYFSPVYWPDFDDAAFDTAVQDYYSRQRRFGKRAEQSKHSTIGDQHLA